MLFVIYSYVIICLNNSLNLRRDVDGVLRNSGPRSALFESYYPWYTEDIAVVCSAMILSDWSKKN